MGLLSSRNLVNIGIGAAMKLILYQKQNKKNIIML